MPNDMPTEVVQKPEGQKRQNVKMMLFGFVGFIGVALIGLGFWGAHRAYAQVATDTFTLAVARVLRLPAIKVNGIAVRYTDYVDDLQAIKKIRDFDKKAGGQLATFTDEQLSDQVLYRLANTALVEKAAKEFGLAVTDADVEKFKTEKLFTELGSKEKAEQVLQERYGWNLAMYEKKFVRPYLLQTKLVEKVGNQTGQEAVQKRAQGILDQIKAGTDFSEMARQYGEDGTAPKGGDLGWFSSGEMVPSFEQAAFALKKGELSPNLVKTEFGYHIIIVDDKKTEKVAEMKTDAKGNEVKTGKMIDKNSVKARHILFAFPTASSYLDKEIRSATIRLYLKIHDPFKELQAAGASK